MDTVGRGGTPSFPCWKCGTEGSALSYIPHFPPQNVFDQIEIRSDPLLAGEMILTREHGELEPDSAFI